MIQPNEGYLDVSMIQDCVIYPQFQNATGGGVFQLETSPVKEENFFLPISTLFSPVAALIPTPIVVRYSGGTSGNPPLEKWLRWHFQGATGAWTFTMRILVVGNPSTLIA